MTKSSALNQAQNFCDKHGISYDRIEEGCSGIRECLFVFLPCSHPLFNEDRLSADFVAYFK